MEFGEKTFSKSAQHSCGGSQSYLVCLGKGARRAAGSEENRWRNPGDSSTGSLAPFCRSAFIEWSIGNRKPCSNSGLARGVCEPASRLLINARQNSRLDLSFPRHAFFIPFVLRLVRPRPRVTVRYQNGP
jgi:hypothetical protein